MSAAHVPESLGRCLTAAKVGCSTSRSRQLSWVATEMAAYAAALPPQQRPARPVDWFEGSLVSRYLAAADSGTLRARGTRQHPSPDSTRRVRRACLRLLATAAGAADPAPSAVALPALRPRVDDQDATRAVHHWRGKALPADARPAEVRTAAMAVLIREAGMRSGELAALAPSDLDLAAGTVTYQPRPPSTRRLPAARTVLLSGPALVVLRHWLEVRAVLIVKTPRTRALWVSLAANHDGTGVRRPAGMPLQPTGLRRAHARAVAALNAELAGSPGFQPLPRNVGQLRGDAAQQT